MISDRYRFFTIGIAQTALEEFFEQIHIYFFRSVAIFGELDEGGSKIFDSPASKDSTRESFRSSTLHVTHG